LSSATGLLQGQRGQHRLPLLQRDGIVFLLSLQRDSNILFVSERRHWLLISLCIEDGNAFSSRGGVKHARLTCLLPTRCIQDGLIYQLVLAGL
jgi:hypothetical protein